jgi:hypothetical protein
MSVREANRIRARKGLTSREHQGHHKGQFKEG